jgi:heme/copper-type cytochrome/quinol oxidase subunit 4
MKKHFKTLFDPAHRWRTIIFFFLAAVLITAAFLVTISDNLPGIALLYAGVVFLFLTFVHPWKKAKSYAILVGICAGILVLIFVGLQIYASIALAPGEIAHPGKAQEAFEGIFFLIVMFFCIPGIIVGLVGMSYRSRKK